MYTLMIEDEASTERYGALGVNRLSTGVHMAARTLCGMAAGCHEVVCHQDHAEFTGIIGHYIWASLLMREGLCIARSCYRFIGTYWEENIFL